MGGVSRRHFLALAVVLGVQSAEPGGALSERGRRAMKEALEFVKPYLRG